MYLSRFGVKNYKCLGEIDIPLTPIHVIIGENDSGKTSLFEAISLFYGIPISDDKQSIPFRVFDLINKRSNESHVNINGRFSNDGSNNTIDYILNLSSKKPSDKIFSAKRSYKLNNEEISLEQPGRQISIEGNKNTWDSDFVRESLNKIIKPIKIYRFDPRIMASPSVIKVETTFQLEANGYGLASLLSDISGRSAKTFVKLCEDYHALFQQYKELRTPKIKNPNGISQEIVFETIHGMEIRAEHVSDGAILILGFLAFSYLPVPPSILLIEEPENGIYPKRLGEVINLLKQLVKRTGPSKFPQILLTTHSPYVLSFFEPEEVTFLSRPPNDPDGPVRARPMRDAPAIRDRLYGGEFYLGELWYNLSEEDLFGEP
jgi:hypothetical protein